MRNRDFVEAAKISGESARRIILAEIMPNLSAVIASSFLFTTIYAIGVYVGLGFLTVVSAGADYNWGTILFDATSSSAVESGFWWWYIPPGIAIALAGHRAGADQLRHRRVHQPAAADRHRRPQAGQEAWDQAASAARLHPGRSPPVALVVVRRAAGLGGGSPVTVATEEALPTVVPSEQRRRIGETLLEIRGLSVDYGLDDEPVHAVDDVDLVIRRGEIVGLAGESGSGKSTLAYAVARLLRDPGVITAGEVYFYDWPKGSYRPRGRCAACGPSGRRVAQRSDLLTDEQRRQCAPCAGRRSRWCSRAR